MDFWSHCTTLFDSHWNNEGLPTHKTSNLFYTLEHFLNVIDALIPSDRLLARLSPFFIGVVISLATIVYSLLKFRPSKKPQRFSSTDTETWFPTVSNSPITNQPDFDLGSTSTRPAEPSASLHYIDHPKEFASEKIDYQTHLKSLRSQLNTDMNDHKRKVIANQITRNFKKQDIKRPMATMALLDDQNAKEVLRFLAPDIQQQFFYSHNPNTTPDLITLKSVFSEISEIWDNEATQQVSSQLKPELEKIISRLSDEELLVAMQVFDPIQIARVILYMGPERSAAAMEYARHSSNTVFDKILSSVTKLSDAEEAYHLDDNIEKQISKIRQANENNQHRRYLQFYKKLIHNADEATADQIMHTLSRESSARDLIKKSIITANTIEHVSMDQRYEILGQLSDLQAAALKDAISAQTYKELIDALPVKQADKIKAARNEFELLSDFLKRKVTKQCKARIISILSEYRDNGELKYLPAKVELNDQTKPNNQNR